MAELVAGTPDGLACLHSDGTIGTANDAFLAMLGAATPTQVSGRRIAGHLLRGEIDLRALTDADCAPVLVTQLIGTDERRRPVEITVATLTGGGHGLIARDIPLADILRAGTPRLHDHAAVSSANLVGEMAQRDIVTASNEAVERSCIEAALALTEDNRAAAAEMLGLSRQSLYVKLRKFGMQDRDDI